ncbi:50S ribosomal protein L4 [Rubinisphaera margarita]|uniref:50S ribosomal protein L4 n=1 Tax=Rubinisphaera margarita TaxID=2909586 RepID=UPI001EE82CF4|nr:50S ribosomal protein L4 [Rubinisphaera margarita]MCG6154950.1 50S ribosomal protein L4 [Rubinisphaera margarita]
MISVPILNQQGSQVGSYDLDPADIAPGVNKQLLHDVVVMYEANRRVGTSATKSRSMVAGSTKKMYRQKGTGNARAGSKRSPIRRGGGHTFAKVPRDWGYRLPKKAVRLATRMALLSKFEDNQVCLVDEFSLSAPKTKEVVTAFKSLKLESAKTLFAIEGYNADLWKASRNIEGLLVRPISELNAYDLLHQRMLLITKSALDALRESKAKSEEQEAVTA